MVNGAGLARTERLWRVVAGISGAIGVIAGAAGAHAAADEHLAKLIETASYYQLIHAAVLLWLASRESTWARLARWLCLAGMVLFCGTLHLKGLGSTAMPGVFAPIGGTAFILAWVAIAIDGLRRG